MMHNHQLCHACLVQQQRIAELEEALTDSESPPTNGESQMLACEVEGCSAPVCQRSERCFTHHIAKLEEALTDSEDARQQLNHERTKQQQRIAGLEARLLKASELREPMRARIKMQEKRIAELEATIEDLESENARLQEEIDCTTNGD